VSTYLLVTALEFGQVLIYFGPFPTLLGWHVGEVALLFAISSLSFGLAELFGGGIDAFSETIRRGDFDRVLLHPAGALLQVATSEFRLRRLGRLTQGMLSFGLALVLLHGLRWTPAKFILMPLALVSGAAIFIAVLLLGAVVCFWTIETTELTSTFT